MIKIGEIQPYTLNLLRIRNLREIGFQVAPETLNYQQWLDLVAVERALVQASKQKRGQPHGPK